MDNWLDHVTLTEDGSPTLNHPEHQQWFHSKAGAATEAKSLYMDASGILESFPLRDLHVADIGLGLGYNVMATVESWLSVTSSKNLRVSSFEHDESLWKTIQIPDTKLTKNYPSFWFDLCRTKKLTHPNGSVFEWDVVLGDLSKNDLNYLPKFDFVWHDPFSPDVNESLWTELFFKKLVASLSEGGTLMTYSVRRSVRDSLAASGFEVIKIPTTTMKKNWLKAKKL